MPNSKPEKVCPLCKSPLVEEYMERMVFECGSKYDSRREKMSIIAQICLDRQSTLQNRLLYEALQIISAEVDLCPKAFDARWNDCEASCLSDAAFKKRSSGCWRRYLMHLAKERWKE